MDNKSISMSIQTNREIMGAEKATDVLSILSSIPGALTKMAGGGALGEINFATSTHRISRFIVRNWDERAEVLSDARYALLICGLAEAFIGMNHEQPLSVLNRESVDIGPDAASFSFNTRELSNIGWALAKIRLLPPTSALPLYKDTSGSHQEIRKRCFELRSLVLKNGNGNARAWVPQLSMLSAMLFDTLATKAVLDKNAKTWSTQEIANLLYSFATSNRANEEAFDALSETMLRVLKTKSLPKPQEFSNTIWAYATAQMHEANQQQLFKAVADTMDANPGFVKSFKGQELANTAWGLATLISGRRGKKYFRPGDEQEKSTEAEKEEDLNVSRILRHVARALVKRPDDFKSQEISNSIWAFGTLGFGVKEGSWQTRETFDTIVIQSDDVQGDRNLVSAAVMAAAKSAIPRIFRFKNQELNNLAWGIAKLGCSNPYLFEAIAIEISRPKRKLSGQDIGVTMWAFATSEYFEQDSYQRVASRLNPSIVHTFKPQELSNPCWAIGTAGVESRYLNAFDTTNFPLKALPSKQDIRRDPITLVFAVAAQEMVRRAPEFISQEIKDILWGFSKVRAPCVLTTLSVGIVRLPRTIHVYIASHLSRPVFFSPLLSYPVLSSPPLPPLFSRILMPRTTVSTRSSRPCGTLNSFALWRNTWSVLPPNLSPMVNFIVAVVWTSFRVKVWVICCGALRDRARYRWNFPS